MSLLSLKYHHVNNISQANNEKFHSRNTEATAPLVTSNEYRVSVVNVNSMCPFILLSEA